MPKVNVQGADGGGKGKGGDKGKGKGYDDWDAKRPRTDSYGGGGGWDDKVAPPPRALSLAARLLACSGEEVGQLELMRAKPVRSASGEVSPNLCCDAFGRELLAGVGSTTFGLMLASFGAEFDRIWAGLTSISPTSTKLRLVSTKAVLLRPG